MQPYSVDETSLGSPDGKFFPDSSRSPSLDTSIKLPSDILPLLRRDKLGYLSVRCTPLLGSFAGALHPYQPQPTPRSYPSCTYVLLKPSTPAARHMLLLHKHNMQKCKDLPLTFSVLLTHPHPPTPEDSPRTVWVGCALKPGHRRPRTLPPAHPLLLQPALGCMLDLG